MTPIDDELRTALQRRATAVAPSPDPLAGIERRAGRMRRNRLAASLAGSALAVAAVATAVPLLTGPTALDAPPASVTRPTAGPTTGPTTGPTSAPTGPPSPAPTRTPPAPSYAFDPAAPWDYRGTPLEQLGQGFSDTVTREYRVRHAGAGVLTPLFGQVHEPSGQAELVFVATVGTEDRWGVVRSSESGPELVVDEPLPEPAFALAAALPGDEVARLLVVAAPEVSAVEYGHDDATEFAAMAALADGVATTPLDGDLATDSYRLLDRAGAEVDRGRAPDPADDPAPRDGEPANLLRDWPARGQASEELRAAAELAFARAVDRAGEPVDSRLLFGGDDDAGNAYVLLQAWVPGDDAYTFGYTVRPDGEAVPFLGPKTDPQTPVLALLVEAAPGQSTDTLVVVPQPTTGQVLYGEAASEYRAVGEDQSLDGVVLVDRTRGATGDRLRLLDGDGDLDAPTFDGAVADLLCGLHGCG